MADSNRLGLKKLMLGLAAVGAALATWHLLGMVACPISTASGGRPPPAVAFVPSSSSAPPGAFFDLSTAAQVNPDIVVSPGDIVDLEHGWSVAEKWGIWALGETASMRVFFDEPRPRTMLIRGWAPKHPDRRRQTVTIHVNGHEVGTIRIYRRPLNRYVTIPQSVQRPGENQVDFDFAYSSAPASSGIGDDARALAVGFCSIGFGTGTERVQPPSARSELVAALARRLGVGLPVADFDAETGTVTVRRAGTIVAPISGTSHPRTLQFRVRAPGHAKPFSSIRRISWTPLDGTATIDLLPEKGALPPVADAVTIDVNLPIGSAAPAVVGIEVDPGSSTAFVESPLFRPDPAPAESAVDLADPTPADSVSKPIADPPDLIIITLDAARPDHFGCYGYGRPTTPNIDHLASESTVFDTAFALAPYTLCSVPTMITGLSFFDHGVVRRGQRLHSEVTTLAEHLVRFGYTTALFTATPNNSRSMGFDQGYETYWESWPGVDEREARDPELLSAAATRWLATVDEGQPLHMQLHYVPPHEPYDPGPLFDIFGDPSYTGPIDGTLETIKAIDRGGFLPTADDLHQLVALYDGNLRRADSAVGTVLKALRNRRRWSNTIVLITADHGEAFYEHNRLGHNSTVFDEMLRVPFILRLPSGYPSPPNDALVTLADIVPTFVSAGARRSTPPGGAGRDLLSVSTKKPGTGFLIARNDRAVPTLAIRSGRWKLIRSSHNRMELFDLVSDPGETIDVLYRHFTVAVGLERLLLQQVRPRAVVDPLDDDVSIDADDAAMLRALGYAD